MGSLQIDDKIDNLGHFLKGRSAFKKIVSEGIKNPEIVVPKLMRAIENSEDKKRKKAVKAYKKIANEVDLFPVLSKIAKLESTFTYSDSQGALSCLGCLYDDNHSYTAVGSRKGSVHLLKGDDLEWENSDITGGVSSVCLHNLSEGKIVVAGTGEAFGDPKESNVHVWNIEGDSLWNGIEPDSWVASLATGKLGRNEVIVGGCGGLQGASKSIYVWNKEGVLLWSASEPDSWISEVVVSDIWGEDMVFASCGDHNIYGWDKDGKLIFNGTKPEESLVDMTTGVLEGEKIVVGVSSNLYVWGKGGDLNWISKSADTWIRCVEIGKFGDNDVIVGGTENGNIYCWNKDGKVILKDDKGSGEINDVIIGNIEEQDIDVIIAGTENGDIYIWEEGSKIKERTVTNLAREDINEIDFSNRNSGEIAVASDDGNLYFSRYNLISLEELLADTEELIPVGELKKEHKLLRKSIDLKDPTKAVEEHKKVIKFAEKIERKRRKGEEIVEDMKLIQDNLIEFEEKNVEITDVSEKFQKSMQVFEKGKIEMCEALLDEILKEVSDIKTKIEKEEEKRTEVIEWVEDLKTDIEKKKLDSKTVKALEPLYEMYQNVHANTPIEEYIGDIREHINKLNNLQNKYLDIPSRNKGAYDMAQELNGFLKEEINDLIKNRQKLRNLKKDKQHLLETIRDSASGMVLQSQSERDWISTDKILNKIKKMEKDLKHDLENAKISSLKILINVMLKLGYGEENVFIPRSYQDKKSLKFGLKRIQERFEEDLEDDTIWNHVNIDKIEKEVNNRNIHSATELLNNFTQNLYRFKMATKIKKRVEKNDDIDILDSFLSNSDIENKIVEIAKKEKKKAKKDMYNLTR